MRFHVDLKFYSHLLLKKYQFSSKSPDILRENTNRNTLQSFAGIMCNKYSSTGFLLTVAFIMIIGTSTAFAQLDQGAITGTVKDSSGAVVPRASVALTQTDTGFRLNHSTDNSGVYVFQPIKIGKYKLSVTSPGFGTTEQDNVTLNMQQRLNVDIVLKPGATAETVVVSAAPPQLQTEEASVNQSFTAKQVDDFPVPNRNVFFIAQLTNGVVPAQANGRYGSRGDFNANGQRAEENNFILDGVDNNVNLVDFLNGSTFAIQPPPDAIAEVKVQTSSYSAEFGHSAGAVVNASIKSGTNEIHGDLWEYLRNNAFDVDEWNAKGSAKTPYRQNIFGATIGFPIWRNKLFAFGDGEANRIVYSQPVNGLSIPTMNMRNGDFRELLNPMLAPAATQPFLLFKAGSAGTVLQQCNGVQNEICINQMNPVAQNYLKLFPAPNVGCNPDGTCDVFNNFNTIRNIRDNTVHWDGRLDYNASVRDQIYVRASYTNNPAYHAPPLGPIVDGGNYNDDGYLLTFQENIMGSYSHSFSPSFSNEARFGFNYVHASATQAGAYQDTASMLGFGGIPYQPGQGGVPQIQFRLQSDTGPPAYYATDEHENVYQIIDNVSKTLGNHSLRAGISLSSIRAAALQAPYPHGQYWYSTFFSSNTGYYGGQAPVTSVTNNWTGDAYAEFLSDYQTNAHLSNLVPDNSFRWDRAAYVQDDWKVNDRLTLNFGVRWEDITPMADHNDNIANFYPIAGSYVLPADINGKASGKGVFVLPSSKRNMSLGPLPGLLAADNIALQYSDQRALQDNKPYQFGPRLGLAYKLDDTSVIRAGFGMYFGGIESTGFNASMSGNYPFSFTDEFDQPNAMPPANSNCYSTPVAYCPSDGIYLATGFSDALNTGLLNYSNPNTHISLNGVDPHHATPYTEQYNLSFERIMARDLSFTLGYVGNVSRHLPAIQNINSPLVLNANNVNVGNNFQPFPDFGGANYLAYASESDYNSLQAKVEKHLSQGLNFVGTYTWSKSLDDGATPLGSTNDGGFRNPNIVPIRMDLGPSPWDTRHRVTLYGNYQLPFGRGKQFLNHNVLADEIVGGWSASLVWRANTGQPFSVGPSNNYVHGANAYAYPVRGIYNAGGTPTPYNGLNGNSCPTKVKTTSNWYNPCAFQNPPDSTAVFGDAQGDIVGMYPNNTILSGPQAIAVLGGSRGSGYGPGFNQTDMAFFKSFHVWREQSFQFRVDAFNLMNTPYYALGNTSDGINGGQIFGVIETQRFTPNSRFFQFAGKYYF
jgi:hypothetical protein